MQIRYAIDYDLRREEFVQRAQLFPDLVTANVELHQLSLAARESLALCNPELPEIYELLASSAAVGTETRDLWKLRINPNAYSVAEIVELWAKEFSAGSGA